MRPFIYYFYTEADLELVKLVVMRNVFFNKQQHEIEIKRFIFVKYIKPRSFCNSCEGPSLQKTKFSNKFDSSAQVKVRGLRRFVKIYFT